jgi:hypothetical protein
MESQITNKPFRLSSIPARIPPDYRSPISEKLWQLRPSSWECSYNAIESCWLRHGAVLIPVY